MGYLSEKNPACVFLQEINTMFQRVIITDVQKINSAQNNYFFLLLPEIILRIVSTAFPSPIGSWDICHAIQSSFLSGY